MAWHEMYSYSTNSDGSTGKNTSWKLLWLSKDITSHMHVEKEMYRKGKAFKLILRQTGCGMTVLGSNSGPLERSSLQKSTRVWSHMELSENKLQNLKRSAILCNRTV